MPDYVEKLVSADYPGTLCTRCEPLALTLPAESVVQIFIMTYRDYATPAAVLLVLSRLFLTVPKRARQNIVSLVKCWLQQCWKDFADDPEVRFSHLRS